MPGSRRRLALAALLLALAWPSSAAEPGIAVIVGAGPAQNKFSREDLALVFRQQKRFGPGGKRIQPVNLPANHPLRRAFSQQVLGRSPEELEDYWRDMYFHGVLPPYVLASEEAMIRYVSSTPGAIGYVSLCLVDHRVAVVMVLDGGSACPRP